MVNKVEVKSVLNKQKKRDEWFLCDYSLNPYYGCAFNCLYCYIRGSKYGAREQGRAASTQEHRARPAGTAIETACEKWRVWHHCPGILERSVCAL